VDGRRRFALRHHVIYFFFSPTVHRIKRDAHQHCGSGLEPPSGLLQLFPEARRDALVAHFVVSGLDTAMRCPAAISRGASFRIDWRRRRSNLTGRKPNGILRRMNREPPRIVRASDQARAEAIECHAFGRTFAHISGVTDLRGWRVDRQEETRRRPDCVLRAGLPAQLRRSCSNVERLSDTALCERVHFCASCHSHFRNTSHVLRLPIQ
jgi:hypothetical protein